MNLTEKEKDLYRRLGYVERGVDCCKTGIIGIILTLLALSLILLAAWPPTASGQEPTKIPTPADATGWALSDLVQIPEADRPFVRYLWIPPWGSERWVPAIGFTVNTAASHARTIQPAAVTANGWMVKYDLRKLAPEPKKLAKLLETWDGLAVDDPYFHVPSANTEIKAAVIAPHLSQEQAAVVAGLTLSTGAVYRADWFIVKALSTLDGGRYYDFRQVNKSPEKGTALDNWLSQRGLFVGTTQAVGGERRAAMFRSGVTGKPRRVDVFPTLTGSVGSITRDISDGVVGADAHPIRSLLDMRFDGSETIVAQPNGLHDFVLSDAKGNIVDEAPPDLVRDHTVKAPFTARLQPAISCIRCHGTEQAEGWQPITNDVQKLLGSRLNVFADVSKTLSAEEVADTLAGFYSLDLDAADGLIGRGRRDYSTAVFRTAQGIQFEEKSIVTAVSKEVSAIYEAYQWDLVTPTIAARELGFLQSKDGKANILDIAMGEPAVGEAVDPVLGFLRIGISINRTDWELVYADAATISERRRKEEK